jgi:Holliday junction resolvase RusA-like endonuclease
MKYFTFKIPGKPQPKERPRFARGKGGQVFTFMPKNTREYEQWVKTCAKEAGVEIMERVKIEVVIAIPCREKVYKTRPSELIEPLKRPDEDNVLKAIKDALEGIAYKNDRDCLDARARYRFLRPGGEPFVRVEIEEVDWVNYLQ